MGKTILLLLLILSFYGCANPGIVQLSPDTYMLFREDHGGIFGSPSSLQAGVIGDANAFAASQGKIAIPISTNYKPIGNGPAQWASFEYQFRVVDKNDVEARRTQLVRNPDIIIKRDDTVKADINVRTKEESDKTPDLYTGLMKLEDLRKKGILTEEEFQIQKKLLLEKQK